MLRHNRQVALRSGQEIGRSAQRAADVEAAGGIAKGRVALKGQLPATGDPCGSQVAQPGPRPRHARPRGSENIRSPTSSGLREGTVATMAGQKIRIRLKAYDHEVVDSSARKIVETGTRTGGQGAGP